MVDAAFWWSNCLQLRWMLWAMSHAAPELELHHDDAGHPADDFDWVMQVRACCRLCQLSLPLIPWSGSGPGSGSGSCRCELAAS